MFIRVRRVLFWLVAVPAIAYLAILTYLYVNQRQLLYQPDQQRPQLGQLRGLGVREVALTTADGLSLLSWYLPPQDGRPVVVYFHGNGGHVGYRPERIRHFAHAGYGALMVEYRGYGGNPGTPDEVGLYADAEAALAFVAQQDVMPERVVLYGESLGSGIAVAMAARHQVGALILESPYTSIAAVAQYHYPYIPAALLIWDKFDSLSRIREVRAPLLVLHGGRDVIVPPQFTMALFAAAAEPKRRWVAEAAGHEDLAAFGALDVAVGFIEQYAGRGR